MLVIMADQVTSPAAHVSVGDLFLGAVFPSLILGGLYVGYVMIYGLIRPGDAPLPKDRPALGWNVLGDVFVTVLPEKRGLSAIHSLSIIAEMDDDHTHSQHSAAFCVHGLHASLCRPAVI